MNQSFLKPSSEASQDHACASPSKETNRSNQRHKKARNPPGFSSRTETTPSPSKTTPSKTTPSNTPSTPNRRRKPFFPARQVYIPIYDPNDNWTDSEDEYDRNGRPRRARVTVKGYQAYLEKRKKRYHQYDLPRPTRKVERLFEKYQGQIGPPVDVSTKAFWVPKKEERGGLIDGGQGQQSGNMDWSLLKGGLLLPGHPEFPEYGGSNESD